MFWAGFDCGILMTIVAFFLGRAYGRRNAKVSANSTLHNSESAPCKHDNLKSRGGIINCEDCGRIWSQ